MGVTFGHGSSNWGRGGGAYEHDAGNSGAAATIDFSVSRYQKLTLTDNAALTLTPDGPGHYQLKLVQDGTGSRVPTWSTTVQWPAATAPELSTDPASEDVVNLYYDGAEWYGQGALAFA